MNLGADSSILETALGTISSDSSSDTDSEGGFENESETEARVCDTCRSTHVVSACALCENDLCKACIMAPPLHTFSLLTTIPDDLSHHSYCRFCYDEKVEPEASKYGATLEKANEVFIFFKTQRKEIPLLRKSKELFKVTECEDRDETILRLAFMAAEKDFNAVIDTEVSAEKKRHHAHHKHYWEGTGIPAMIDENKLDRQFKRDQIYR